MPLGIRTWGYDATHADTADGPYRAVDSIGDLAPSSLQVYAENPTDGIAWLMVRSGDDTVWFGNAQVSVPAKAWTTISQDASTTYQWEARHNDGTATGDTFSGTVGDLVSHVGGGHAARRDRLRAGLQRRGPLLPRRLPGRHDR